MGLELFADLPDAPSASPQASSSGLFDDLPDQQPGLYQNGQRVRVDAPVPVQSFEGGQTRSGGAGIDRLIGSDTGMTGYGPSDAERARTGSTVPQDPYDLKKAAEEAAAALVQTRSRISTDIGNAPVSEFEQPNALFAMERQRAEAEARRTGQPVQVSPMEPTPQQLDETMRLEAEQRKQQEIARAGTGFDAAQKAQRAVITGQPQSQDAARNAGESLAAGIVGVPAGAVDALAIIGQKIAQTTESADTIRDLNQSVQQYMNGLARPDPTQADDILTSKLPQGIGSTFGFGVAGKIGAALGLNATASIALAGALPQASQSYRDAEVKGATELEKWIAFAGGLGLGATEALPIANAMERWAQQVPGFRRAFRDTAVSIAEESTQEFGQQLGGNALAKAAYDPNRSLTEGVAENALVGGLTGGLMGGAGSFGNAALMREQAGEGQSAAIDLPAPNVPPLDPALSGIPSPAVPEGVPQGAQPGEVLLGPDPSMQPPAPPPVSDPRFALQDMLDDPRSADELRAAMQTDGRLPAPPPPAPPPLPTGDRTDPVRIDTPESVNVGAERTATPTPAQAEAGNYTKRHVNWNGLDISIETEAGQDRNGVAPDGTPWSVTLPAPYGYIKRTTGADGDQVDVYVGPNPQGRVFVVDQIDPETKRFDEHKVMLGFDSQEQAQAYYEAGFSDGRGGERAAAITEMGTPQFKQWAQNANLKRPLSYQPPVSAGLTTEQYAGLKQAIKDGGQSLQPDKLAQAIGARPQDVRTVLQRLAGRNELRMSNDGKFSRVPQRTYPLELLQFLAERGGIDTKQAREVRDLDKQFLPGFGRLVRPTGRKLDEAREAAVEAGYLREGATINDLLDAMEWSTRGRKRFSALDQARVTELDGRSADTDSANEHLAELDRQFAGAIAELGVDPAYAEIIEASELVRDGLSPQDALVTAIERMAVRSVDYGHDAGWMNDADWRDFDTAFGVRYREPEAPQQQARTPQQETNDAQIADWFKSNSGSEGNGPGAPQDVGRQGPVASGEAGPAPAGEQSREAGPAEEVGADNKPQLVIPGAERIGQGEQAQRAADKPLAAKTEQKEPDGLFGDLADSRQLFDDIASTPAPKAAEPPKSAGLAKIKAKRDAKAPKLEPISHTHKNRDDTEYTNPSRKLSDLHDSGMSKIEMFKQLRAEGYPEDDVATAAGLWARMDDEAAAKTAMIDKLEAAAKRRDGESDLEFFNRIIKQHYQLSGREEIEDLRVASRALDPVIGDVESVEYPAIKSKIKQARIQVMQRPDGWVAAGDMSRADAGSHGGPSIWDRNPSPTRNEAARVFAEKRLYPFFEGSLNDKTVPEKDIERLREWVDREFPPPAAPTPASKGPTGASNTVFTASAADKARARLKAKLSGAQLNSGIDPEIIQDGITLAGYHIEAGARSFAAYSKAMIEDLGEAISPYLRSLYESVRHYPGFDAKGMSSAAEIEAAPSTMEPAPAAPKVEAGTPKVETPTVEPVKPSVDRAPKTEVKSDRETIAEAMRSELVNGASYKTIREARALAEKATGGRITPSTETAKLIDEAVELGVVLAARDIVAEGKPAGETYDRLVKLYEQQPSLNVRTSTSMIEQAYSTPVPLAYVASQLAGIDSNTTVYEPTAGNGALLIAAKPDNVVANELNPDRRAALEAQGFDTMGRDASAGSTGKAAREANGGKTFDVVIENPPFGPVKDDNGNSQSFKIDDRYSTNEIDHAIVMRSLTSLSRDGKAVLIVGGPNKLAASQAARSNAYNGKAKREFYLTLYSEYNVVDHFTVNGDLYAKQGAGYPVDVIVIDGRGKSTRKVPAAQVPAVINSWDELRRKLDVDETTATANREADGTVQRPDAAGSEGRLAQSRDGVVGTGADTAGRGEQPVRGAEPVGTDRSGQQPVDGSAQLQPEQRVREGDAGQNPAGVQRRPSIAQQGQASLFDTDSSAETAPATQSKAEPKPRQAPAPAVPAAADMSKPQVPYRPRSNAHPMGTLVPVNMQTTSQDALTNLEKRVGNIDEYVTRELGYDSVEQMIGYFGAEQVDGIALGIDNFAKGAGVIIGDQTGIGKGRQVAGILRWAMRKGKVPIFVTEKPNLYADMYRDLTDIGINEMLGRELSIFMTNSGERVPLDEDGKKAIKSAQAGPHMAEMKRMTAAGKPTGYDMIFTTYSQMQTVKGAETERQRFLRTMAGNDSVMALDEAHNAGGQANARERVNEDGTKVITRADFVRELVGLTSAALYSSATYAKRPDVMDLYFKTDMALAVDDISKLGELIQNGGIPMQQIVAAMLSRAGQYVRRERSFDGISYDTPIVEVDTEKYEEFSRDIALIQQFSENFVKGAVTKMDEELKEQGKASVSDNSTGSAGASSTNFTAVMHNIINQLLLSMKAQDAADRAIAKLKAGLKPVITLANTNESFIDEYAESVNAAVGDAINVRFNDVLQRYLDRSRTVTVREPFSKPGEAKRIYLTDAQLGPEGVESYREAKAAIAKADFSGLPVSPIDWIRGQLTQAGYTVSEITGRGLTLDYRKDGSAALKMRPGSEKSIAGRRQAIGGYNSGKIDVLILNQSGSTGLSLHASEKVLNKNKRHMIIAQAEGNIDTHMQMLGRVNRTGQVVKPSYDQLVAGIPAEKRPASILSKKMASLNANTTGARDSAVTAKDTPDFMNSYGDQVAAMVMRENPDINERLGEPVSPDADTIEGSMRKVTGRIPLLPLKEQEELYDLLESEYKALIDQLEAAGQNALEAKTMELDAKTIGTMQAKEGKEGDSPFADAVYFEQVDAKRLGKPMMPEQVIAAVAKGMDIAVPDRNDDRAKLEHLAATGRIAAKEERADALRQFTSYRAAEKLRIKKDEAKKQNDVKLDDIKTRWEAIHEIATPGQGIVVKTSEGNFYGVVLKTEFSGRAKNPLAMSAWRVNIALADPARSMSVPFSQLYTERTAPKETGTYDMEIKQANSIGSMPLLDAFADMQIERREERIIVTGNILAGYDFLGGKGQIVNFTDNEGRLRQGILLARGFDAEKFLAKKAVQLREGRQVQTYIDRVPKSLVVSSDKFVTVARNQRTGDTLITIDSARQNGGKYYLNRAVLDAAGKDFVKVGNYMRLEVPPYKAPQVVDAIIKAGATFEVSDNIDVAREIAGKVAFSPAGWDTVEGGPQEKTMTPADKQAIAEIVGRVAGHEFSMGFPERIDVPAGTPAAKAWGKENEAFQAGGYYNWVDDVIAVAQNIGSPSVAYHEAFHRLQGRALTKEQAAVLVAEKERLKDIVRRSILKRNVDIMAQSEIEADAFAMFAMARDQERTPEGFPARVRMIFEKFYRLLRATANALKGRGFQTYEDIFDKAWRGDLADAADANTGNLGRPDLQFSIPPDAQNTVENRKNLLMQAIGKGQPLDRIMRLPFDIFGALDSDGRWKFGAKLDAEAKRIITEAKLDPNGRFGWMESIVENARAGLIDRYGLDEDYTKRDRARANDERAVLSKGREILDSLLARNLSAEEAQVLQAMLTGEAISDGDMGKLAEPIREAIDQLGQQAVELGLISAESFERNRGSYLHRVYQKHEGDQNGLTRMVDRVMTSRRKQIMGDQLKGRGIFLDVSSERITQDDPEFGKAGRGAVVKGERFIMIRKTTEQINTDGETEERETKRIWWPADKPIPAKYQGLKDGGTWEARAVGPNGKVTLWRDYTKAERSKMGEILDARYTIGKTYSMMAHDLANGKFFKDIAEHDGWSQSQVPDQPWKNAAEYSRYWNDPAIEWVKVPDTEIPNTGGKKRWGALSGRYVRSEIWRDLNETFVAQNPSVWRRLLSVWKLNKTARSPVTHMNNVMSNLMFMDLADIRIQDLVRGVKAFVKKDASFKEAQDNGAFGNDMMAVEFNRDVLRPLLDELQQQETTNGVANPWFAKAAAAGKMADLLWQGVKKLDQKMVDAYRIEDELFRMATFIKRREMGDSPQEAADFARRQFLDYDIKAPWVAAARNTVLPFISYVYRAVPLIAEAIAHRPWKLAKYFTVAYGLNALAYAIAGDDGDEDRERASLRKDEQGWLWIGVPRMMRMPWRDANGLPVFLDIRRWTPAGDIFDAGQGSSALPLPAPLMPGGPIMLGAEFALNKVGFTGKGITNERTDSWWDSTGKTADWAWKSIMPNAPWVPGSWSGERIAKAVRGGADRAGNPLSLKEAVSSSFGIKLAGRDIDQGFQFKFYEQRKIQQDLKQEARALSQQRSKNLISQSVFERGLADIVTKQKRVAEDTSKIADQNRTKQQKEAAK